MCILYAFVFTRVHTSACARLYMPTCVRECTVYMRTFIYVHLCMHVSAVCMCVHTLHTFVCAGKHLCTSVLCIRVLSCMYVHVHGCALCMYMHSTPCMYAHICVPHVCLHMCA